MSDLRTTPLHDQHTALGARMAPFGGWIMPIQYTGIIEEHLHTRHAAGLFDICHMGEFKVKGPRAAEDLDALITARIATLKPGRCRYGFLLNESGCVLDDLITYRLADDEFMLVVNAGTAESDKAWIEARLSAGTYFEDMSAGMAKLDLQGPQAGDVLRQVTDTHLELMKYFSFVKGVVCGCEVLISRTGYTGEFGFELYAASSDAVYLWQKLLTDNRVRPVGLGARDTLRLEAGLPLYGHELGTQRTPAGTPFSFAMDMSKPFTGRDAVAQELERGPAQKLAGIVFPGRQSAR